MQGVSLRRVLAHPKNEAEMTNIALLGLDVKSDARPVMKYVKGPVIEKFKLLPEY